MVERSFSGVLIYGVGGHSKVVVDVVERQEEYRVVGFLDDNPGLWGKDILGYRVLGDFSALINKGLLRHPVVIAIGDNQVRARLAVKLKDIGCSFARIIHPSAQIARNAQIGPGTMIMANVAINPGTRIGAHTIVNTGATVDHDCIVYDFVHISPAAVLAGNVVVGEGAHIGMACSVLPNVQIGEHSILGAGAVVTRNIAAGVTAFGVPAKPVSVWRNNAKNHAYPIGKT